MKGFAQKVACISSAGADDVKIAQRFIAGVRSGKRFSPRSGRLKTKSRISITAEISETLSFSRPFHGLICKSRFDPSTKVLGYSHSVRFADNTNFRFLGQTLIKSSQRSGAPICERFGGPARIPWANFTCAIKRNSGLSN